ncbi:M60 family metallopeptidase [Bacteroides sp.]|uniref:M60 family metallopeptidase n=1 Tax=Bacteroides sp. TaxID=29523 RepID=UPI002FC70052
MKTIYSLPGIIAFAGKCIYRYCALISVGIILVSACSDQPEVSVQKVEPESYVPGGDLGLAEDVRVVVTNAIASSFQPGQEIKYAYDGDLSTKYHSNWKNTDANYFPITLEFQFREAEAIDYLVYTPRPDAGNGSFKQVEIQVSTKERPEFEKYCDYDFKGSGSPTRVNLGKTAHAPLAIRLIVKSGVGNLASCVEIEFFKKGGIDFDPSTIFADLACSTLKPGITEKEIEAIPNAFFKNIASHLFTETYPLEYRVQDYAPYPDPDRLAATYKISPYSLRDNPTGMSVGMNEELVVMVGKLPNHPVSLLVQDLETGFGGSSYPLVEGINAFKTKNKGLIYIMYYTPDDSEQPPVKIHIASGKVNGVFRLGKNKKQDWSKMLNQATDKHFDVVGNYAHFTFPVAELKQYCTDGERLIQVYDSIVRLEQNFMGIDIPNHLYMHVSYVPTDYMYATSYRTAYQQSTLKEICDPVKVHSTAVWGPAHEMGHVHQTRPGFKWHGMTEVTNNVQSLLVQTVFGNPSRIQGKQGGFDTYNSVYELAFSRIIVAGIGHNELTKSTGAGDEENTSGNEIVFMKTVPFWQLQLYEESVRGKKEFYPTLYGLIRTSPNPTDDGKAQLAFTKWASVAAQEDLTDFFRAWGFYVPMSKDIFDYGVKKVTVSQTDIDQTLREIKALNLPKPKTAFQYIIDRTVELFKTGGSVVKGQMSISGRTVRMLNWQNTVAYELYDNDRLVYVSAEPEFTLDGAGYNKMKVYGIAADGTKVEATN